MANLHFTVTGEYMTERFRSLWNEGLPERAFNGLKESLIGISDELVMQILYGKLKLTGDSDKGITGENDNKSCKTAQELVPLCEWEYFKLLDNNGGDLAREMKQVEWIYNFLELDLNDFHKKVNMYVNYVKANNIISNQTIKDIIAGIDVLAEDEDENEDYLVFNAKKAGITLVDRKLSEMVATNKIDVVEAEDPKTTEFTSGYIAPDGKFYPCYDEQHTWLAEKLFEQGLLDIDENIVETYDLKITNREYINPLDIDYAFRCHSWVKISMRRVFMKSRAKWTDPQVETLMDLIENYGIEKSIRYNLATVTLDELLESI